MEVDAKGDKEEAVDDVVVEGDADGVAVEGEGVETPDDDPAAGIAALKAQIAAFEEREKQRQQELESTRRNAHEARAAREEAERRAEQARQQAWQTDRRAREAAYTSVVNALSAAESTLAQQQSAAQQAAIDGDWARHSQLSADIGKTAARVAQLEAGKVEFEGQLRQQPQPQQQAQQQPVSESDQREAFIRRLPPKSAAWVRDHQDRYFNDSSFSTMVAGAHQLAMGRGLQQESDDYFRFIEEQCGLRAPEAQMETHRDSAPQQGGSPSPRAPTSAAGSTQSRRSPTPAAPAASGTGGSARSTGDRSVSVQLSAEEREFCRTNEISEENYAKQKKQLMDEKRLGPQAVH